MRSLSVANLSKVAVAVDVLFLVTVLQLVVFNVQPESLHDAGTCLRVHTQQTGQAGVQFVLWGLGTHTVSGQWKEQRPKRQWERAEVPGGPA